MTKATTFPLVLLLATIGCADDAPPAEDPTEYCETCNLDNQVPAVAVEGAIDCGEARLNEDASAATMCIEQALANGSAFFVRQQLQGIDSSVIYAWVTADDGTIQRLSYDSNICGGGECNEDCGPRVSMAECGAARIGADPDQSLVDCDLGSFSSLCEPPI